MMRAPAFKPFTGLLMILAVGRFWGASLVHAKPGDAVEKPRPTLTQHEIASRILVFGTGEPVGIISVRRSGAGSQEPWQKLQNGRAVGKVRVPAGYDIRLDVDPRASGDLALLDSLSPGDLQMINMADSGITDAGLARIAKFKGMKILNLRKNPVTDKGMVHLTGMTLLETLYLDDTQITDEGLDQLKNMKTLYHLNLGESGKPEIGHPRRIGDPGVGKLSGLVSLVYLDLSGSAVTDAGLQNLSALKGLYHLNLARTRVTESSLELVASLGGVRELNISGTGGITSSGLARLLAMASLVKLTVHTGQIPAELLKELKSRRSAVEVVEVAP